MKEKRMKEKEWEERGVLNVMPSMITCFHVPMQLATLVCAQAETIYPTRTVTTRRLQANRVNSTVL
jgi:hypothetical protein